MSIEVSCAVWKWSKQKGSQLLLLVAIADYANAEGIAWPSINSLSRRTRLGPRYVQKMLRELEAAGEIVTVKRTQTSNVYRVTVGDPAEIKGANPGSPPPPNPGSPAGAPGFAPPPNPGSPDPSKEPSENRSEVEAIYQAYPKKVAKASALKAIGKALGKIEAGKLLELTLAYAAAVGSWPEDDRRFVPYPATWFNRGSFEDDPTNWKRTYDAPNRATNPRRFEQQQSYAGVENV